MHPTSEPDPTPLDSGRGPNACLERTRSHVLNVLVAVGLSIAVSGWLLRKRALAWQPRPARALSDGLYGGLIALTVASYVVKRVLSARTHRAEPGRRERLFYWSHIGPAILAAPGAAAGACLWLAGHPAARGDHSLLGRSPGIRVPVVATTGRAGGRWRFCSRAGIGFVMTNAQITILGIYAVIVAIWPIRLIVIEVILSRQRVLGTSSPRYQQPRAPLVSAILPAKDEEINLAGCLSSVCGQTYPNLEIVVVDDRSTDRTGEIARAFAERDKRVRVLSIEHLPPGWTGKTHALDQALRHAGGEWLWFFDADTVHAPESLSIIMEYGRSECDAGPPAARAEVRDVLGKGGAASGGDHAHAVVPAACRER